MENTRQDNLLMHGYGTVDKQDTWNALKKPVIPMNQRDCNTCLYLPEPSLCDICQECMLHDKEVDDPMPRYKWKQNE